ncbi:MAG: hypothetical protein K9M08_06140 [Pirellula sp.]|nr:hypothetical protein [Pirellula sp.]
MIKNLNAKFCRDCGGPAKPYGEFVTCENTTTSGERQDPKDIRLPLERFERIFCEFDGCMVASGQVVARFVDAQLQFLE